MNSLEVTWCVIQSKKAMLSSRNRGFAVAATNHNPCCLSVDHCIARAVTLPTLTKTLWSQNTSMQRKCLSFLSHARLMVLDSKIDWGTAPNFCLLGRFFLQFAAHGCWVLSNAWQLLMVLIHFGMQNLEMNALNTVWWKWGHGHWTHQNSAPATHRVKSIKDWRCILGARTHCQWMGQLQSHGHFADEDKFPGQVQMCQQTSWGNVKFLHKKQGQALAQPLSMVLKLILMLSLSHKHIEQIWKENWKIKIPDMITVNQNQTCGNWVFSLNLISNIFEVFWNVRDDVFFGKSMKKSKLLSLVVCEDSTVSLFWVQFAVLPLSEWTTEDSDTMWHSVVVWSGVNPLESASVWCLEGWCVAVLFNLLMVLFEMSCAELIKNHLLCIIELCMHNAKIFHSLIQQHHIIAELPRHSQIWPNCQSINHLKLTMIDTVTICGQQRQQWQHRKQGGESESD